jgi:selenocysteine lyase/cysteine desulfurase
MATFSIDGWEAENIHAHLFNTRGLHTSPVKWEQLNGVRVSPHLYTSEAELDMLVEEIMVLLKG